MDTVYISPQPELRIKAGILKDLPRILTDRGFRAVAVVTGGRSIRGKEVWSVLTDTFLSHGVSFLDFTVRGEPSPDLVDRFREEVEVEMADCDAIVAIGGGSVMDTAKALAASLGMRKAGILKKGGSIAQFLEGVGTQRPDGSTLPLIAVPTTAGTGSEATKNAVLSVVGPEGFKKSLRHDNYVPICALIDPEIQMGAPDGVTRASGLDAVTQLIEVYMSIAANGVTDTLAREGLRRAGRSLPRLLRGEDTLSLRADMAIAAYFSGVGLASAGLGVVHGLASPGGALRDIPHGVLCGLTLAPSIRRTITGDDDDAHRRIRRYAQIASAMGIPPDAGFASGGEDNNVDDLGSAREVVSLLVETLENWAAPLGRLGTYGFTNEDLRFIAARSGNKNHPGTLTEDDRYEILRAVL